MRDRDIEEKIARLQELISMWNRFHEITVAVLKGAEFGDELEREFLEIKSSIARKFQSLADRFPRRTFPDEEVSAVLSQVVSLSQLKEFSSFAGGEFQNQWHKVYISFNRMLGHLESERDQLARVSSMGMFIKRIFRSKFFKLLVIAAIIAAVYVGVQKQDALDEAEVGDAVEDVIDRGQIREYLQDFINRFRREGE